MKVFFFLITEEGNHLKDLGVDTNLISKQFFLRNSRESCALDLLLQEHNLMEGCCKKDDELRIP